MNLLLGFSFLTDSSSRWGMGEADSASGLKNFTSLEAFAAKEFGAVVVVVVGSSSSSSSSSSNSSSSSSSSGGGSSSSSKQW